MSDPSFPFIIPVTVSCYPPGGIGSTTIIPDDANTIFHLYVKGGVIKDTKSNVITEVGSVTRVGPTSLGYPNGAVAEGLGPFSAGNYLRLPSGLFNFADNFWWTVIGKTGAQNSTNNPVIAAYGGSVAHGTGFALFVTDTGGSPAFAFNGLTYKDNFGNGMLSPAGVNTNTQFLVSQGVSAPRYFAARDQLGAASDPSFTNGMLAFAGQPTMGSGSSPNPGGGGVGPSNVILYEVRVTRTAPTVALLNALHSATVSGSLAQPLPPAGPGAYVIQCLPPPLAPFNIVPNGGFEIAGGGNAGLSDWNSTTGQAHQSNVGASAHSGSNVVQIPCSNIFNDFDVFTSPDLTNIGFYSLSTKVWSLWFQQNSGTPIDPASTTIAVFVAFQFRTAGGTFLAEARYFIAGNKASFIVNDSSHITTMAYRVTPTVGTWQHFSLDLTLAETALGTSGHTIADVGQIHLVLSAHGGGATFTIWWDDLWIGSGTSP